ncbi:MAG: Uma2 family endonuclease [Candidatus Kapabacteria bacterium]|jgi:Uma2 family endonuclease|nr:Uma2 family endonuclease [Candidatus Kapabacteria bacterium]
METGLVESQTVRNGGDIGLEIIQELDISHIETEDGKPLDNTFSERQQHLLIDVIHASWQPPKGKSFVALSNVGLFYGLHKTPIVPDFMLSLGVKFPNNAWEKHNRAYFNWEYGKLPELVVEIVSNVRGNELDAKLDLYAFIGIPNYLVFDPAGHYGSDTVRLFVLRNNEYQRSETLIMQGLDLACTLWTGEYNAMTDTWLRWTTPDGTLLLTGEERAERERERAEHERERAEHERERAEEAITLATEERMRAERLAQRLRELGINPEEV